MFDGIAGRYDLLNHLLSLNLDRRWRRIAARELTGRPVASVLDLCGGTGDLTLEIARQVAPDRTVCCDFSHGMLARAAEKFARAGTAHGAACRVLEADGLQLPLADATLDAVTVGFGVRNFHDLDAGLGEIARVLRPGGCLVVLEFSRPTGPLLGGMYGFYLRRILPRIGDNVSGRSGPYNYLAHTIADFDDEPSLAARIRAAGFSECTWQNLTGGIVAVHTATR